MKNLEAALTQKRASSSLSASHDSDLHAAARAFPSGRRFNGALSVTLECRLHCNNSSCGGDSVPPQSTDSPDLWELEMVESVSPLPGDEVHFDLASEVSEDRQP
eukprot:1695329-Amphidinium_carterae.1